MMSAPISRAPFGKTPDGQEVEIFTLRNINGLETRIMTYGGIVVSLKTPDKSGQFDDIVMGYDSLDEYVKRNPYFGALIGRYGNRIAKGRFSLNGTTFSLAQNNDAKN
ncbi:MAG TPA: galactose-1-epimerase, partial [Alphaproteobacteria bacterium]|nr:galactose-1-epimerase [Alphaproteobacteria bacterium]